MRADDGHIARGDRRSRTTKNTLIRIESAGSFVENSYKTAKTPGSDGDIGTAIVRQRGAISGGSGGSGGLQGQFSVAASEYIRVHYQVRERGGACLEIPSLCLSGPSRCVSGGGLSAMRASSRFADFSVARRRCRLRGILPLRPSRHYSTDHSLEARAMRCRRTENDLLRPGIGTESYVASG